MSTWEEELEKFSEEKVKAIYEQMRSEYRLHCLIFDEKFEVLEPLDKIIPKLDKADMQLLVLFHYNNNILYPIHIRLRPLLNKSLQKFMRKGIVREKRWHRVELSENGELIKMQVVKEYVWQRKARK